MKKTALVAALAFVSLGLAGCEKKAEEATETATEATADAMAAPSDAMGDATEAADASTDGQGSGVTRPPAP